LVDYTGRLFRERNAAISREVAEVFDRLGMTAEIWKWVFAAETGESGASRPIARDWLVPGAVLGPTHHESAASTIIALRMGASPRFSSFRPLSPIVVFANRLADPNRLRRCHVAC